MNWSNGKLIGLAAVVVGMMAFVVGASVALATGSACPDATATAVPGQAVVFHCTTACPNPDTCNLFSYTNSAGTHYSCACYHNGAPYSPSGTLCVLEFLSPPTGGGGFSCITAQCPSPCTGPSAGYPGPNDYGCGCE